MRYLNKLVNLLLEQSGMPEVDLQAAWVAVVEVAKAVWGWVRGQ